MGRTFIDFEVHPAEMTSITSAFPTAVPPSLLIVVLDIHPISWSLLSKPSSARQHPKPNGDTPEPNLVSKVQIAPVSLSEFVTILLVFLNSHLASRWGNRVVVFAASAGRSKLLYPTAREEGDTSANAYHPFGLLDKGLEVELKEMIIEEEGRISDVKGEGLNGMYSRPTLPFRLQCADWKNHLLSSQL